MTAKQARQIKQKETGPLLEKIMPQVYSEIKAAAKNGDDDCTVHFEDEVSDGLIVSVKDVLFERGFRAFIKDKKSMFIRWELE